MKRIEDNYLNSLINEIRDSNTNSDIIKNNLYILGQRMGQAISGDYLTEKHTVFTPMGVEHYGLHLINKRVVVVSTKDDYKYFAKGLASTIKGVMQGYMDFEGVRGIVALSHPIRAISLPEVPARQIVDCVIIAKSVLATGCTAISLTKKAIDLYNPRNIIIATVFYSDYGVSELLGELATAEIYAFGNPEEVNDDGMLVPGFGNLDARINT